MQAGQKLEFDTGRIVQAYPIITLEAEAGTELAFDPFGVRYVARAGRQTHFTIDTRGFSHGEILVKTGAATITGLKLIERLYPYNRLGCLHLQRSVPEPALGNVRALLRSVERGFLCGLRRPRARGVDG